MGNSSILGLLFEINADPSKAEAALKRFEQAAQTTLQRTTAGTDAARRQQDDLGAGLARLASAETAAYREAAVRAQAAGRAFDTDLTPAIGRTTGEIRQAHGAAMVLEQQFGIRLPRGITAMLSHSALIGPALTAAFAPVAIGLFLEYIPKIIKGIQDAADSFGGFGEEAKKAFEETVKASDDALIHFQGLTKAAKIADGQFLIMQTNQRLAALETEKSNVAATRSWTDYLKMAGAMGAVGFVQVWNARSLKDVNDDIAKQQVLLMKQLGSLGTLETEIHKERKTHHAEEKSQVTEIANLFRELSVAVITTDASYRQYLETQAKINTLRTEWHRIILSELNDERFRQKMAMEGAKLAKDEADFTFKATIELKNYNAVADQETAAHKRLEEGVKSLVIHAKELRQEWILSHTQLRMMTSDVHNQFIPAFQAAGATMQNFRVMGTNALADFERGMASNIAQAIVYQTSIGAAMQAALKSTLASLASEGYYQALKATALGFLLIAQGDWEGSAAAFVSAGYWAALGTGAAAAGASGGSLSASATAGASTPAAEQGPRYQIVIQGSVIGDIDDLARRLSEAVMERDVNLTSYTVVRQPALRA